MPEAKPGHCIRRSTRCARLIRRQSAAGIAWAAWHEYFSSEIISKKK